jgi:hypothetical protein
MPLDAALQSATKPEGAGRIKWSSLQARPAPDGMMLPPAGAPAAAASSPPTAVLAGVFLWYGLTVFLGLLAWPWLAALWPGLPDRGYGMARMAGVLAIGGCTWWLTWLGLAMWSRNGLLLLVAVLCVGTVLHVRRRRAWHREWIRKELRYLLVVEGLFLALFLLGLGLRLVHPDLWAPTLGGEKPMDFALLNSVLTAPGFPPPDPWFSGGRLN